MAGSRTADGRAILANDMHLPLSLPNAWYRVILEWPTGDDGEDLNRMVGVTLPGSPAVVVGSNSRVAWGFTNSYGDWSDLVILEIDGDRYLTPDGYRDFEIRGENIEVRGGEPVAFEVRSTIWGPVIDEDHRGRPRALSWIAHDPAAVNLGLLDLEHASTVEEAQAVANRTGIPPQNFVCDDRALFLERWRRLVLDLLDDEALAGNPGRAKFRDLVAETWTGRASIDSQACRLVRTFRFNAFDLVYGRLTAPCEEADERFDISLFTQWEASLWRLLNERPDHLLGPEHGSWEEGRRTPFLPGETTSVLTLEPAPILGSCSPSRSTHPSVWPRLTWRCRSSTTRRRG